jgi:hypothetical protein
MTELELVTMQASHFDRDLDLEIAREGYRAQHGIRTQVCPYHERLQVTIDETHTAVAGIVADMHAEKRRRSWFRWLIGVEITLVGIVVSAIVTVQVARIGATKESAETLRRERVETIRAVLAEQQRPR